jgi:NAD(P)-dependent dehydrogenase (short-subunit alcohol dehydrogenase family)
MSNKLSGKWALVTGSSRGIGQQLALGLASEGANVIVHGRKLENTKETLRLLGRFDVERFAVAGDLASAERIDAVIAGVWAGTNQLDILYNNAGIGSGSKRIFDFEQSDWERVLQVNLFAMVALCNVFVPPMMERGWGRVVNVSSGIQNQPNLVPYSVSKAAVDKYSRDLAVAARPGGVLVNYLDPGWLKTDMGGVNAFHDVETVLPGGLVPVLLDDDGPSGQLFRAQEYR